MRYTRFGRPILKDSEIEQIAYRFLAQYDESYLHAPSEAPVGGLLTHVKERYGTRIVFANLGDDGKDRIIGRTIFSKNMICIDEDIVHNDQPLFLSAAAHELGHWVLHRDRPIRLEGSERNIDQLSDSEKDLWGRIKLKTTRDWLEHQAKIFAASLLMPRSALTEAVINKQCQMGISRNLGKIYLDLQKSSEEDFAEIVSCLQSSFCTSKQSIEIRLKEIGILQEDKRRRLRHISEV